MTIIYGIKSCDTVRKARKWLQENAIEHRFHDLREDGLDKAELQRWIAELGWEVLLNKRSTTWKQLSEADRANLDEANATALMLVYPTLIKRPVLVHNGHYRVGFKEADYRALFA